MKIIDMTSEELLRLFGDKASEQLEIAIIESGFSLNNPRWEEVFIDLDLITS